MLPRLLTDAVFGRTKLLDISLDVLAGFYHENVTGKFVQNALSRTAYEDTFESTSRCSTHYHQIDFELFGEPNQQFLRYALMEMRLRIIDGTVLE